MQSSYIEVERARSKPIFQKCHTLPSETNCTSGESREIYLDEDVIIFTDVLLHNVTGEGVVPTILPWPAARAEARAPLFAMLPRLERPPCV